MSYFIDRIIVFIRIYNIILVYNRDSRNFMIFLILIEMILFYYLEYFVLVFDR